MTEDQEVITVLIDGVTEFGITHAISANLARHVLAVLRDAGYAVEKLPEPVDLGTVPLTGTRRATFGPIVAYLYSSGTWVLVNPISDDTWTNEDDHHALATGLLAGARWAQREAAT